MNGNGQKPPATDKDTIYIDVEDEITSVIDKVKSSESKIVALVLPKRATMLQSIVNMKLLKRTAQTSKKNIVLITSEQALLPLAGAAGMYVAPNLGSKPEIPPPPSEKPATPYDSGSNEAQNVPAEDSPINVASAEAPVKDKSAKDANEKAKSSKKKGPKVPNFESFRKKLIFGGFAVLLLIAGIVLALYVLPSATITLATDTQNIDTNFNFTADTTAESLDIESNVIPAKKQEYRGTDSEKVRATGQKDLGKKASGEVTLQLTSCDKGSVTIPSGTAVSTGNLNFITQDSVTLQRALIGNSCLNEDFPDISSDTVDVIAQEAGDQYNLSSGKSFSVAGYSDVEASNDDKFSGGTSKIVQVVTQGDVDKAMSAIQSRANDDAPDELKNDLNDEGYYPISATLVAKEPLITTSPNVGDESKEVTVTATTSYTMAGVKEEQLKELIKSKATENIDKKRQGVNDFSLDEATISLRGESGESEQIELLIDITLTAGPELDKQQLKKDLAGKNNDEINKYFEGRPGINDVETDFSPFWVNKAPKSPAKIKIDIKNESQ